MSKRTLRKQGKCAPANATKKCRDCSGETMVARLGQRKNSAFSGLIRVLSCSGEQTATAC
eukprot:1158320-Pelagomonas_calceolata.AAC.7